MGNYNKANKRFNLTVSIQDTSENGAAVKDELLQWKASFNHASEMLFKATGGQQQLGKIFVCLDKSGGKNADIWIGSYGSSSSNARIWEDDTHAQLDLRERFRPFMILHELGHYLYGLGDENMTEAGEGASCLGPIVYYNAGEAPTACIMERNWDEGDRFGVKGDGLGDDGNPVLDESGSGSEVVADIVAGGTTTFCDATNHDKDIGEFDGAANTQQHYLYKEHFSDTDCWTVILDTYPDLVPYDEAVLGTLQSIEWEVLVNEQRFVLAIDRSASMVGAPLEAAILGATMWIDEPETPPPPPAKKGWLSTGVHLGVVAFNHESELFPVDNAPAESPWLRKIEGLADRDEAAEFIKSKTAKFSTASGDALRKALNMIQHPGDQAVTQAIVLLSDGMHNTGEDPLDVLPDLIDAGVRAYTIAVGPAADVERMAAIAEGSGAKFFVIEDEVEIVDGEIASTTPGTIDHALWILTQEADSFGGVVTAAAAVLGGWDPNAVLLESNKNISGGEN